MKIKPVIFSVGHSNRSIEEFIDILKKHEISVLADARSRPYSRFLPHFNKNALHRALEAQSIQYLWLGQSIGGLDANVGYDKTIIELSKLAKRGIKLCIACSEKNFKKCHRYLTLTPSFEKQGLVVKHI